MIRHCNDSTPADVVQAIAGEQRRLLELDQGSAMTPDELVSFNLKRARELRGWAQQEAAAAISQHLGRTWSVQSYGDAERAYRSRRVKTFSASELVALCSAFELPLGWFFRTEGGGDGPFTQDDAATRSDFGGGLLSGAKVMERLRNIRLARGLTVQTVADRSGLERSLIAELEKGFRETFDLDEARLISEALGVDLRVVLGDEPMSIATKVYV